MIHALEEPPKVWADWSRNSLYTSVPWLRLSAADPSTVGLAVSEAAGTPLAGAPVTRVDSPLTGNYDWTAALIGRGLPPTRSRGRGLMFGAPAGYQGRVLGDVAAGGADLVAEIRAASDADVVLPYARTEDAAVLVGRGLAPVPVFLEAEAWFHGVREGWDTWLATLSASRRRRVVRDVRSFERAGNRTRLVRIGEALDVLPRLALELARKLGRDPRIERFEEEFGAYARHLPGSHVLLCEDAAGAVRGFCLYIVAGSVCYLRWGAFDYPALTGHGAEYVNVCFYEQIRRSPELGVTEIHAGKSVLDAKVLRGATLEPLWLLDLDPASPLYEVQDAVRWENARRIAVLRENQVLHQAVESGAGWPAPSEYAEGTPWT